MKRSIFLKLFLLLIVFSISCTADRHDNKGVEPDYESGENRTFEEKTAGAGSPDYMPGEVLVRFKEGTAANTIQAIQNEVGLNTIRIVPKLNIYRMKILDASPVEEVIEQLESFDSVVYAEPNYKQTFDQD